MKQFTREEILERYRKKIAANEPLIMNGAGIGIIAGVSDHANIDMIMAYCTGPYRMEGQASILGSMPYSNSTEVTMELGRMLRLVRNTPVTAGVSAGDPYYDYEYIINRYMEQGFSGITNVPSVSRTGDTRIRGYFDECGMGFDNEIEMAKYCRKNNIFSVFYGYTYDDVRALCAAGVDAIGLHVGGTSGGLLGFKNVPSMDAACEKTQKMLEIAKQENPDVITLSHGGPFDSAANIKVGFERTGVDGFIGASSLERIPVEKALMDISKQFLAVKLG